MNRRRHKFEDILRLIPLLALLLLPAKAWAQIPIAIQLGHAVSVEALKPDFATNVAISRAAPESKPSLGFGRSSPAIQAALNPIATKIAPSVVEVRSEHDLICLGTIVSSDGLVVCKHSELTDKFYCVLPNGGKYWGRLIGIHPQKDLALFQVATSELKPIVFRPVETVTPGSLVVSVGHEEATIGFGMVSMPPHDFGLAQPKCRDCIDLGVTVAAAPFFQEDPNRQPEIASGLEVLRVYPRSAAERCGLLVGDLLAAINGIQLTSRNHLNEVTKSIKIGQTLTLRVFRKGEIVSLSTKIKSFASPTLHDRWGGGPFSDRRFGFSSIIAHDSVVLPEHCGGPLVRLDGRVIGINIARSMRVATFSIPIEDVLEFVKLVRPNAELQIESVEPATTIPR